MIALIIITIVFTAFVIQHIRLKIKQVSAQHPAELKPGNVFYVMYADQPRKAICLKNDPKNSVIYYQVYELFVIPTFHCIRSYRSLENFKLLNYEK